MPFQFRQPQVEGFIKAGIFIPQLSERGGLKLPQEIQLCCAQPEVDISRNRALSNEAKILSGTMGNEQGDVLCKSRLFPESAQPGGLVAEQRVDRSALTRLHQIKRPVLLFVQQEDSVF